MQLPEVQPGDVVTIIKARADTPVTVERIRIIVQRFYNHAIRNLLVTTNPATRIQCGDDRRTGTDGLSPSGRKATRAGRAAAKVTMAPA